MTTERLCDLGDLPEGQTKIFEVGDWRLAAARSGESVFVLEDRCSHDDGEFDGGTLHDLSADGGEIECPRHGGRFNIATGRATHMPAIAPIETFAARVEDGVVFVDVPEF